MRPCTWIQLDVQGFWTVTTWRSCSPCVSQLDTDGTSPSHPRCYSQPKPTKTKSSWKQHALLIYRQASNHNPLSPMPWSPRWIIDSLLRYVIVCCPYPRSTATYGPQRGRYGPETRNHPLPPSRGGMHHPSKSHRHGSQERKNEVQQTQLEVADVQENVSMLMRHTLQILWRSGIAIRPSHGICLISWNFPP